MDDFEQPTVGALLKSRRQELGLSLAEIAAKTHIRRTYLEALEADLFEALPGHAYQSGFLRNYAEALDLGPDSVLRQWRQQMGKAGESRRGELTVAAPVPVRVSSPGRPGRRAALLLLPLLIVAAIGLHLFVGSPGGAEAPTPAPPLPAPARPGALPARPSPGDAALPPPAGVAAAEGAPVAGHAENPAVPDAAALPAIPAEGGVIRLETLAPLSVEVAVDSRPPQGYVLSAASALQWTVGRSVRLTVDNPSSVKLWLGDEPLDLAGRSEIVLQTDASVQGEVKR